MTDETQALPDAEPAAASIDPAIEAAKAIDQDANAGELTPEQQAKPEKTPEQREIERLRRGIDRRTRQLSDARAQLDLTRGKNDVTYQQTADDSEPLSLTRAELAEMVKAEAHKLAPTLREQAAETERRQSVVQSLAKTWGQDKFDQLSSDLDDAFSGLSERSGQPKAATEAIFEADDPAKVIEWLTDPDNIDEAERISRMTAVQAGKAIAKLETKLASETQKDKPKPSKAAAPLEAVKGAAPVKKALTELTGADFDARRREQIKNRYR
jgi:predicted transposase YbfD/YdcC